MFIYVRHGCEILSIAKTTYVIIIVNVIDVWRDDDVTASRMNNTNNKGCNRP